MGKTPFAQRATEEMDSENAFPLAFFVIEMTLAGVERVPFCTIRPNAGLFWEIPHFEPLRFAKILPSFPDRRPCGL